MHVRLNNAGPNKSSKYKIDIEVLNHNNEHVAYMELKANTTFFNPKDKNLIYSYHTNDHRNLFWKEREPNGDHSWYAYLDFNTKKLYVMSDNAQIEKMLDMNDRSQTLYGNIYNDIPDDKLTIKERLVYGKIADPVNDYMYIKTLKPESGIWQTIIDVKEEIANSPELKKWIE